MPGKESLKNFRKFRKDEQNRDIVLRLAKRREDLGKLGNLERENSSRKLENWITTRLVLTKEIFST